MLLHRQLCRYMYRQCTRCNILCYVKLTQHTFTSQIIFFYCWYFVFFEWVNNEWTARLIVMIAYLRWATSGSFFVARVSFIIWQYSCLASSVFFCLSPFLNLFLYHFPKSFSVMYLCCDASNDVVFLCKLALSMMLVSVDSSILSSQCSQIESVLWRWCPLKYHNCSLGLWYLSHFVILRPITFFSRLLLSLEGCKLNL